MSLVQDFLKPYGAEISSNRYRFDRLEKFLRFIGNIRRVLESILCGKKFSRSIVVHQLCHTSTLSIQFCTLVVTESCR